MGKLLVDVEVKGASKIDDLTKKTDKLDKSTKSTNSSFETLGRTLSIATAGAVAVKIIKIADSWQNVENKLKLVTSSSAELARTQKDLFNIAQDTRSEYEATAKLYATLARSSEELGTSQEDLYTITTAVNQSLVISGASATESASTIRQLSQALASGVLRGDEFNSLMENSPRIMEAISDSMGVAIGQLREMASEGQLTSEIITNALVEQSIAIEDEYSSMTQTVGQSWQQLENSVGNFINTANTATGATNNLAISMAWVSQAVDEANEFWFGDVAVNAQLAWIERQDKKLQQMREERGLLQDIKPQMDGIAKALERNLQLEKEDLRVAEEQAFFAEQKRIATEQLISANAWYMESETNASLAVQNATQSVAENTAIIEANTVAKIANAESTGNHDLSAGNTYSVIASNNNPFGIFAGVIDNSITSINNFDYSINNTTSNLNFLTIALADIANIANIIGEDLAEASREIIFGSGDDNLSFRDALTATEEAIEALNNDTTNVDLAEEYKTQSDKLLDSLKYLDDTSNFASSQAQQLEKFRAQRAIDQLDEARMEVAEEADANLEALNQIKDAIYGTDTTDNVNAVKDALDGANGVTDKVTAVEGVLDNVSYYVSDNMSQTSLTGKVKRVNTSDNGYWDATNERWVSTGGSNTIYEYYKSGGYTGNGGINDEVGIVHGQEYVVNAQSTKDLGLNGTGGVFSVMASRLATIEEILLEELKTSKKIQRLQQENNTILDDSIGA